MIVLVPMKGVEVKRMKSELERIPGVGKNMVQHLINAGYRGKV